MTVTAATAAMTAAGPASPVAAVNGVQDGDAVRRGSATDAHRAPPRKPDPIITAADELQGGAGGVTRRAGHAAPHAAARPPPSALETQHSGAVGTPRSRRVPFDVLCNSGAAITSRNWLSKLWRYLIVPTKELYVPFILAKEPTNYIMLTFRTFNRDFDLPNHNDDFLAERLRDALMPARGALHRARSPALRFRTRLLDTKYLGIPGIVNFIDARTQWFDDGVRTALDDGITQVVVVAAGFDTRAYRLHRPGVRFYEVDMPEPSAKKQQLVAELFKEFPHPEFVGADLSRIELLDALASTSFDPSKRCLIMMEGLIYYLPPQAVRQQLKCISSTAAEGSIFMFDFLHLSTLSGEKFHPGFETLMVAVWNKGEVMRSGIDERPQAVTHLLARFGFELLQLATARQLQASYLPHLSWADSSPAISPYFGFIKAVTAESPEDTAAKLASFPSMTD